MIFDNGTALFWQFTAGIGLFLFGMHHLESSLKRMSSRKFKEFLVRQTGSKWRSILAGTATTAVLQSSTVVSLFVLAFVASGLLSLSSGIGVILGASLGTTFTGWIVAAVGFKLNIASVSMPFVAIGTIGMIASSSMKKSMYNRFQIIVGLGFLILGLGLMKESSAVLSTLLDFEDLQKLPIIAFVLIAFFLTALIQSSTAMMTITLASLDAGIISLLPAAAMVIGGDLGTTTTTILGSIGGSNLKKQAALGQFLFALTKGTIAFLTMDWILNFIDSTFHYTDKLLTIVAFHTGINVIAILVFYPYLRHFSDFLSRQFISTPTTITEHIHRVEPQVYIAATEANFKEILGFFRILIFFMRSSLSLSENSKVAGPKSHYQSLPLNKVYRLAKSMEGDILCYSLRIQNNLSDGRRVESKLVQSQIDALRHGGLAMKALKNVRHNIREMADSLQDIQTLFYEGIRIHLEETLNTFEAGLIQFEESRRPPKEVIEALQSQGHQFSETWNFRVYQQGQANRIERADIATLLNVGREIYTVSKFLALALETMQAPPSADDPPTEFTPL
jgi:phosphate:Na+ symporter